MTEGRPGRIAAAAAALALLGAPAAALVQDPAEAQAKRAEDLMDRLYADHGDAALLREAEALLEECLREGNHRTAEFVAGQIVYHRPDRLEDRHRYDRILLAKGDREQAERDLRALLRERPSDCAAYELLAGLLRDDGRIREAVAVHESHLREHPGDAGALLATADLALWEARDLDGARAAIRRMRDAAAAPGVPERTARWLVENADALDGHAARLLRERESILRAEARAGRLLWASLGGFLALLAGAAWGTRRRG